jgi:glycerol-3-phosphate acyltransferase PlsY
MAAEIVLVGVGYLFGSLPFSVALARLRGVDTSEEEDLHIALWHRTGKKLAILAGAVDFFKGVIIVLIGFGLGISSIAVAFSGVATVAGQMWPPPYGGGGEKGNAPGVAVVMTLSLVYGVYWALLSLMFFAAGAALKYYYESHSTISHETEDDEAKSYAASHPLALSLPLGMLLGFMAAPVASWYSQGPTIIVQALLALLIIIVVRRLTADLKADLRRGKVTMTMLIDRFLFDQLLEGQK